MRVYLRTFFLILFTANSLSLFGRCPNQIYCGPEFYHMIRWRDGGTKQRGTLFGGRIGYDRILPCSWYVGGDFLYASGNLMGHSGKGSELFSIITDSIVEGRLGFTFFNPQSRCSFFVPYGGYGFFHETNNFHSPSPLPIKTTETFEYVAIGFLSGINFAPLLSMGINFKVRFMLNSESKVTDDPLFDNRTLKMNNETQYRLEIPITPCFSLPCNHFLVSLVPFYESRHFGGRSGFPFDFIDTKFRLLGARLQVTARF